ncbi:hypothetical protein [Streptomyces thermolilacinus]|uniref:hypothetical protein n=1 Tax=Streptomyces thermolilacinus TaxID=285540 RepID=UPI0033F3C694
MFGAQDQAAVEELCGVVRGEPESTGNGGAFVVADEGQQDLAAGGVGHGPAGGFHGVGDAAGGAVFDDVPPPGVVVPDVELEVGALRGAVLLGVRTEHAPSEQRGVGVALEVDGCSQEPVDFLLRVLAGLLGADE